MFKQVVRRCPWHMDPMKHMDSMQRSVSRQRSTGSGRNPPALPVPPGRKFDALALGCDQTPFAETENETDGAA